VFDNLFGPQGATRDPEESIVLDGAMGTQIQGLGFDEDHFAATASSAAPATRRATTTF
jgi:methionine synthase I (cobalamin-dependent)